MRRMAMRGTALALALALVLAAVPAGAQDAEALTERLRVEFSLSEPEAAEIGPRVRRHLARGGDEGQMREMVRAAVAEGCRGACLGEALRAVNRAMALGYAPDEAGRMVREELRQAARDKGPASLADRLRARMERRHRRITPPVDRVG